jgi:hypothetical protein
MGVPSGGLSTKALNSQELRRRDHLYNTRTLWQGSFKNTVCSVATLLHNLANAEIDLEPMFTRKKL